MGEPFLTTSGSTWPDEDAEAGVNNAKRDVMKQAFRSLRRKSKPRPYDEIVKNRRSTTHSTDNGGLGEESELLNPSSGSLNRSRRSRSRRIGSSGGVGFSESVDVYIRPADHDEYDESPWLQRSLQQ